MDNISGTYICPKCSHKYKWEYVEMLRNKLTDPWQSYHVATFNDATHVSKDESLSDKDKYRFTCNCPNCDEPNSFDYIISRV